MLVAQGCDRIIPANDSCVITPAVLNAGQFDDGFPDSAFNNCMQRIGMLARNSEIGSATKHFPPGRKTRNTSRSTSNLSATTRNNLEITMESTDSASKGSAHTFACTKSQFERSKFSARNR